MQNRFGQCHRRTCFNSSSSTLTPRSAVAPRRPSFAVAIILPVHCSAVRFPSLTMSSTPMLSPVATVVASSPSASAASLDNSSVSSSLHHDGRELDADPQLASVVPKKRRTNVSEQDDRTGATTIVSSTSSVLEWQPANDNDDRHSRTGDNENRSTLSASECDAGHLVAASQSCGGDGADVDVDVDIVDDDLDDPIIEDVPRPPVRSNAYHAASATPNVTPSDAASPRQRTVLKKRPRAVTAGVRLDQLNATWHIEGVRAATAIATTRANVAAMDGSGTGQQ